MISATEGFINQSERYSSNNAGKSLKKYTLLKKGELAYNHGYSKTRNFGSCFTLEIEQARIPFVYHSSCGDDWVLVLNVCFLQSFMKCLENFSYFCASEKQFITHTFQ